CSEGIYGIAAQRNRYGHTLPALVITLAMTRADFVKLPMHSSRMSIVNLHPVDADVAGPGFGIARVHICQGDKTTAVFGPAFEDWQIVQRKVVSIFDEMHDFLAWGITHGFWASVQEMNSLLEHIQAFAKIGRRFCFQNVLSFLGY